MGIVLQTAGGASAADSKRQASKEEAANIVCKEAAGSGPTEVVKALYRAYPFEGEKVPENEPVHVLLKYFDETLARLFVKNHDCERRTGDLCKLTVSVLYAAQDADIKDLRVCE